ncbi:MAG: hypothetical protein Q9227_007283 [Pyrenula ochraceoflavens]
MASRYALAALAFVQSVYGAYTLEDTYDHTNFFEGFALDNSPEKNGGFVTYVDYNTATSSGMVSVTSNTVKMGMDHTETLTTNGPGRKGIRAVSNKSYNSGLFIFDVLHNPGGICGSFPALWTLGPNWPYDGEIDIIEQINLYNTNQYTLHSGMNANCWNSDGLPQTGSNIGNNCNQGLNGSFGCAIADNQQNSFGAAFNANQGGVQAMEWTANYIHFWFFPRGEIPQDITNGAPTPRKWGAPTADFGLGCSIPSNFIDHQIIFMTDACGDWVHNDWPSSCLKKTGYSDCPSYVAGKPGDFANAYWEGTFGFLSLLRSGYAT